MLDFGLISLPAAYVLASLTTCPTMAPPAVDVQLRASDPPHYTNMTSQELTTGYGNNPDSTLATDGQWMIGGLTLTDIAGEYSVNFVTQTDTTTHLTCLGVREVDVDIVYTPQIFIASDFLGPDKKCRYLVTMAHEQKHVATDLETINDFAPEIRRQLREYAATLEMEGPFNPEDIDGQQQLITQAVEDAASPVIDQLVQVRRARQAAIDTIANYRAETAMCPGEFPNFNGDAQ